MECEFSDPEKTREEVEELKRSTKKIKEDHPPLAPQRPLEVGLLVRQCPTRLGS